MNLILTYYFLHGYFYVGHAPWPHHWINGDPWRYER